jgi:hypothetical protein
MFHAEVDASRNLLKVSYTKHVVVEDTRFGEERIRLLMPELKPGFRLLTDLSAVESIDLACVPYIRRVMDLCNANGVERVVRVIPDPQKDIGFNILSLFHYRRRVKIVTCETLAEAMRALED